MSHFGGGTSTGKFGKTLQVDKGYMGKRYITISDMLVFNLLIYDW